MQIHKNNSNSLLVTSAAAAVLLLVGAGCTPAPKVNEMPSVEATVETSAGTVTTEATNTPTETQPTGGSMPETTEPKKMEAFLYKDGTYTAVGAYKSPAGPETIGITLTIKDDVITDAVAEVKATAPKSVIMQNDFAANFKVMVVGKNINDVALAKVSGSSLTGTGFNDAVVKIRAQAKI